MDKNLEKLKKLFEVMEQDSLTQKDFNDSFENVVKVIKKVEAKHDKTVADLKQTIETLREQISSESNQSNASLVGQIDEKLSEIVPELRKKESEIDVKLSSLLDGVDGIDGEKGEPGKDGKDADEEKIVKEVLDEVKELIEERLKVVNDRIAKIPRKAGGGTPHNLTQVVDLTSQTDGGNKAFSIPVARHFIMLFCPDHPIIYRPNTDYTVAGRTLTLTSEVDAPQSGQTLLLLYVK